jgi:hypothetical protein
VTAHTGGMQGTTAISIMLDANLIEEKIGCMERLWIGWSDRSTSAVGLSVSQ